MTSTLFPKKMILAAIGFLMATGIQAQEAMHFEKTTFDEIKAKAKKEHKLIFMDCYTTWCGPCKSMSSETFTDEQVGDYFNARFINAKFDMEDGEGIDIAKKYEVMCYPNLLIMDEDGNLLHRSAGYKDAEAFIEFAKIAQDPEKRFSAIKKQYEQNKNNKEIILAYIDQLENTCLPKEEVTKVYMSMLTEQDFKNPNNWSFLSSMSTDFDSRLFRYVVKNITYYEDAHTADSVESYVMNVLYSHTKKIADDENYNDAKFTSFLNEVKNMQLDFVKDDQYFRIKLYLNSLRENWDEYIKIAMAEGDKYITSDMTNSVCWSFYMHAKDKASFMKAESWMKKFIMSVKSEYDWAMELSKEVPQKMIDWKVEESMYDRAKAFLAENDLYPQYDTYAAILFKLKNKKEAIKYANLAIGIAKKYDLDYSSTETLLENNKKSK